MGELSGNGTIKGNPVIGSSTLLVGGLSTSSTFSGILQDNGGGKTALTKVGNGALMLTGTSSYTGATAVNAGRLLVNGRLGNSAVSVNSGGLLGGSGSILGSVSILAGGTFSPGNSPGLLSVNSLALEGTALMEIDGTTRATQYDGADVTGLLTYGGSMLIDFGTDITSAFTNGTTFNLFDFGSYSGGFTSIVTANDGSFYAGLTFASTGSGDTWVATKDSQRLEFTHSTGNLVIVPEPGAIALAGIAIPAAAYMLRRRRRMG